MADVSTNVSKEFGLRLFELYRAIQNDLIPTECNPLFLSHSHSVLLQFYGQLKPFADEGEKKKLESKFGSLNKYMNNYNNMGTETKHLNYQNCKLRITECSSELVELAMRKGIFPKSVDTQEAMKYG